MIASRMLCSFVLLVFLGAIMCCAGSRLSHMKNDSWYTGIPQDVSDLKGWSQIESERLHEVSPAMEARAQAALERSSYVVFTMDQAVEMLGYSPRSVLGTKLYLVRSLLLNEKTGSYYISTLDNYLWVHHASLGRSPVTMKRRALVLQLKEAPKQVFVTCSSAE